MAKSTFYLKSCEGLPDELWEVAAMAIEKEKVLFFSCLSLVLLIRFISDESINRFKGEMNFQVHVRTIFEAAFYTFLVSRLTWVLEILDSLTTAFYVFSSTDLNATSISPLDAAEKSILGFFSKAFWKNLAAYAALKIHEGILFLMHYARAFLLIIYALTAPLAAIGSLLGRDSFSGWSRSYINIACWGITLNLFEGISVAFNKALITSTSGGACFCCSLVLGILILNTPTITSSFIGSAITPNLAPVMQQANNSARRLASKGAKLLPGAVKAVGRVLRFLSPLKFTK